jgi:TRAP-type C4-dicarboxylate transport system substrate-binding protein
MIEKNTGGRVKIKFYWANALMSPKETLPGIASGVADIGIASGAYDPAKLPGMQILEHAYNASDIWVGVRATNRLFQTMPVLQQQLNRNGVTWVAPYTSGTFQFFLKDKWNSPADFKGKVVRSMGGARALWYEKLGAKPVFIQVNEIFEVMERGTIWGMENTLSLADNLKHYEIVKTLVVLNSGVVMSNACAMNLKKFNSLPKDIQKIIVDTGADWGENYLARAIAETEQAIVEAWEKKGIKVVKPSAQDLAMMKKAGREAATELAEKEDQKLKTPGQVAGILKALWTEVDKAEKELADKGYPWAR